MAHFDRYLTFALLCSCAVLADARAQTSAKPERHLYFTVFAAQPILDLAYTPQPGSAALPLRFYPTARSPQYSYRGPADLQFLDAASGVVIAEVNLPRTILNALFILLPLDRGDPSRMRYRVQVLDDDKSKHTPGTLVILNLSGLELAGSINGRQVTVGDGISSPLALGRSVTIDLRTPFKGRSYPAYAETIALKGSNRAWLLLLPPYRRGSLEVQSRVLLDIP